VEVAGDELQRAQELRPALEQALNQAGFTAVELRRYLSPAERALIPPTD